VLLIHHQSERELNSKKNDDVKAETNAG